MAQNLFGTHLFNNWAIGGGAASVALNASNLAVAAMFRAKGGQAITKIGVNIAGIVTPPVYIGALESVVSNVPSGTILGGASPASVLFTPTNGVNGWTWLTLANAYTPTLGDNLALTFRYSSGTIGTSNYAYFNFRQGTNYLYSPWPSNYNGSVWVTSYGQFPTLGVGYADGSVEPWFSTNASAGTVSPGTGTSPNEYGIQFVAHGNMTIDSVIARIRMFSGTTGVVTVYDVNNASLIGADNTSWSASIDGEGPGNPGWYVFPITPLLLTDGATYNIGIKPTSVSTFDLTKYTFPDVASKRAWFGDASFISRTGTGAWTVDTLSMLDVGPTVWSDVAGGSGGVVNNYNKVQNIYMAPGEEW